MTHGDSQMKYIVSALAAVLAIAGFISPSEARLRLRGMSAETFAQKVATSDQFEIQSSQLALQKSQKDDVKRFAQTMIDDHTKTSEKLKETLKQANLPEPNPQLDGEHQALLTKLNKVDGAAFDRAYAKDQLKGHQQAVRLLENYSKRGDNDALKKFASDILPTIQHHLQMAQALNPRNVSARR
jgi:putative membrane protein